MKRQSNEYYKQKFIERATKLHNGKFDYSKVEYFKSNIPVTIICPEHGEYSQIMSDHLKYQGCPRCRTVEQSKRQTLSQAEFIAKSRALWGDKYTYENTVYIGYKYDITLTCVKHSHSFNIEAGTHLKPQQVQQCPYCRFEVSRKQHGTLENFVSKYKDTDTYFYMLHLTSSDTNESFYRIGISASDKGLDSTIRRTPYEIEHIELIKLRAEATYRLETDIIVNNRNFSYTPKKRMTGMRYYCFSKVDLPNYLVKYL